MLTPNRQFVSVRYTAQRRTHTIITMNTEPTPTDTISPADPTPVAPPTPPTPPTPAAAPTAPRVKVAHKIPHSGRPVTPPIPMSTPPHAPIPNHMVKAVLVTLLCCLPLGIVSIVKASSVDSLVAAGKYREARIASDAADYWANWGIGLGVISNIIGFILQVAVESM